MINFFQKKFVANILVLWSFYPIFRLTDFLSDPLDFSSSKTVITGSAQGTLISLKRLSARLQVCDSQTVLETYTYGAKDGS